MANAMRYWGFLHTSVRVMLPLYSGSEPRWPCQKGCVQSTQSFQSPLNPADYQGVGGSSAMEWGRLLKIHFTRFLLGLTYGDLGHSLRAPEKVT
jgi:hypothetical protein